MSAEKFIDIEKLIASKNPRLLKWMPKFILSYLKKVLHENDVNHFILNNKENHNEHFCQAVIDHFNIKLTINGIMSQAVVLQLYTTQMEVWSI